MSGTDELAAVLRAWRERLEPRDAGLPANGRRRTRGLRREELAMLAGMSVDYVVRLEQGRASGPSAQVCAALGRALQLSDSEQAHLFQLAGHATGGGRISGLVPSTVHRLLERLDDRPIAVFDAMWTLLLWNPIWAALMGDPSERTEPERNSVWLHFAAVETPRRVIDPAQHEAFQASMVADLRMVTARYPDDPRPPALVADLLRVSERFRTLWAAHEVAGHVEAAKSIEHPQVGRVDLNCDVLTVARGDLRVVVFTAEPDTESAAKLALLSTIGTQPLVGHV